MKLPKAIRGQIKKIILSLVAFMLIFFFTNATEYGIAQEDSSSAEQILINALPRQTDLKQGIEWVLSDDVYTHMQQLVGDAGVMWHGKTGRETFSGEWTCRVRASCRWFDRDYTMGYESQKTPEGFQHYVINNWYSVSGQVYPDLPGGVIFHPDNRSYFQQYEIFFWKSPEYTGRIMVEGPPDIIDSRAEVERLAKLIYSRLPDANGSIPSALNPDGDPATGTLPAGNDPGQNGSNTPGSAPGRSLSGANLSAGALFAAVGLTALVTLFGSVGVALTNGMSLQGVWSELTNFFGSVIPGKVVESPLEAEPAIYPEEPVRENLEMNFLSSDEEESFWRQVEEDSILIPELEKKIENIGKQKLRAEKELHNLSQYYVAGPDEASTFPHLKEGEAYRMMPDPFRGREEGRFDLSNAREQKVDQLNRLEQEEIKIKTELMNRNPQRYMIRELPEIFEQIHDLERQKELLNWEKYITEKRRDAGPFGPGKITKNAADEILNRVERGLIEADLKLEKLRQTRSASLDKLQKGSRNDLYALLKEETDQKVKSLELTKALLKEVGTESYYDKTHYYDQEWLDLKVKEINKQIEELINN